MKTTTRSAHYNVRFVLDRAVISTVVQVPHHDDDGFDYDQDDSAIDVATEFLRDEYGLDMNSYKVEDIDVELEGLS